MTSQRIGSGILLFSLLTTVLIVAAADVFNQTHLFNRDWPPHARFHIGMQFTALVLISLYSFIGWRNRDWNRAAIAPITFWPGLFVAWMIPGTSPYAAPALEEMGFAINLVIAGVWTGLTALGWKLAKH